MQCYTAEPVLRRSDSDEADVCGYIAEVVTSANNFVNGRFEKAAGLGILPGLVIVAGRQCPPHGNINRRTGRNLHANMHGSPR